MTSKSVICSALAIGFLISSYADFPAIAAPVCKDSYQLISGQWIGTPYCGDKWLSKVTGVPFSVIRNSPSERRRACLMFGADVKVQSVCGIDAAPYLPSR